MLASERSISEQSNQSSLLQKWRAKQATASAIQQITHHGEEGLFPLSFGQESLWFLQQVQPESASYHIPVACRLYGRLELSHLQRSLTELLRRHWILRTTFEEVDGQPMQRIQPATEFALKLTDGRQLAPQEREDWLVEQATRSYQQPFNLRTGPLFRGELFLLGEQDCVLVLTLHHLITDGWSNGLLLEELGQLYREYVTGEAVSLVEPKYQYVDLVAWQRQRFQEGALANDLTYWREALEGAPAQLDLPVDHPRPRVQTSQGATYTFSIPRHLAVDLQQVVQQEGVTPAMFLFSIFNVLLFRYTNQADISVGMPIFNRLRAETDRVVGQFVNTVVLRTSMAGNPGFRTLLQQIRQTMIAASDHQEYPFEKVVEALRPERSTDSSPLFQVMFAVRAGVETEEIWPDLTLRPYAVNQSSVDFDLTLEVTESIEGTRLSLLYRTDLFEASSIERMGTHFSQLLEAALAQPDAPVGSLSLLSLAEQAQVLQDWNATQVAYPGPHTLVALFEAQVQRSPEAVSLSFQREHLSYSELNARANQLAHYLLRQHLPLETLVGLALERSLDLVIALLAVVKAGGAYLPLDPHYPAARLQAMWEDAQMPWIVSRTELSDRFAGCSASLLRLDEAAAQIQQEPRTNPQRPIQPEQLAYVIYTSGSTGQPKGAMNEHQGICNRLLWGQQEYGLTSQDVVLQKTPTSFDVSVWEFFWPLITGARLVLAKPEGHKDARYLGQLIKSEGITTLHFVPSMLHIFLEEVERESCRSVQRVMCSGEALSLELQNRFFEYSAAALHNLYGPTEAAVEVTHWTCERDSGRHCVPIGRPVANTQIYLLNRWKQPVPVGVAGELYIGGVQVGRGYLRREALTPEKFVPDPFSRQGGARLYKTGDLARYLADGTLEYLGRIDQQVKLRGFRIELGEIEAVLAQLEQVRECAVLLHRFAADDQRLVAYVVATTGAEAEEAVVRHWLASRLPEYMLPSLFVWLPALPLTTSGKLDRKSLPDPLSSREVHFPRHMPSSDLERSIAAIWQEVLHLPSCGVHDNFFELGGHSLLMVQVRNKIQERLSVDLSILDLFQFTTIHSLADSLRSSRTVIQPSLETASSRAQLQLQARKSRRIERK